MTARFRISAPVPGDGFWLVRVARSDPPAGGAASGRTPEEAHNQALAIVRDVLAADAEREARQ